MKDGEDSSTEIYRLSDSKGAVIAPRVERATGIWARMRGLMGRESLELGHGLWIQPCNGIHTLGMRFAIDVLVLDRERRIRQIKRGLTPWRILAPISGGHSVVELAAGTLSLNLRVGDTIDLTRSTDRDSTSET